MIFLNSCPSILWHRAKIIYLRPQFLHGEVAQLVRAHDS